MRIISASAHFENPPAGESILKTIERAGRVCYKSESKIGEDTAEEFVRRLIKRGHESVLEHVSLSARIICDRGVSHELVRHRLASYSQESTRYCNYAGDQFGGSICVIRPPWVSDPSEIEGDRAWRAAMAHAEDAYFYLLNLGFSPQQARAVLPNSLKTEVIMTANIREWRHFFRLRCAPAAHPQMREVANMLLEEAIALAPVLFEDIKEDLQ